MSLLQRTYEEKPEFWPHGLTVGHFGKDDLWLVKDASSGEQVGWVGWQERSEGDKKIGYYAIGIDEAQRGKGFGTAAVKSLLEKKASGVDEVRALIADDNAPSRALARKLDIPMEDFKGQLKAANVGAVVSQVAKSQPSLLQKYVLHGLGAAMPAAVTYAGTEGSGSSQTDRLSAAAMAGLIGGALQDSAAPLGLRFARLLGPSFTVGAITGAGHYAGKASDSLTNVAKAGEKALDGVTELSGSVKEGLPWAVGTSLAATVLGAGAVTYAARKQKAFTDKLHALELQLQGGQGTPNTTPEVAEVGSPAAEEIDPKYLKYFEEFERDAQLEKTGSFVNVLKGLVKGIPAAAGALPLNIALTSGEVFKQSPDSQEGLSQHAPFVNAAGLVTAGVGANDTFRRLGGLRRNGMISPRNLVAGTLTGVGYGMIPSFLDSAAHSFLVRPGTDAINAIEPVMNNAVEFTGNLNGATKTWADLSMAAKAAIIGVPLAATAATFLSTKQREDSVNDLVNYITERERNRVGDVELPEERALRTMKELAEQEVPGTENMPAPWRGDPEMDKAANWGKAVVPWILPTLTGAGMGYTWDKALHGDAPYVTGDTKHDFLRLLKLITTGGAGVLGAKTMRTDPKKGLGIITMLPAGEQAALAAVDLFSANANLARTKDQLMKSPTPTPTGGAATTPSGDSGNTGKMLLAGGAGIGALALAMVALRGKQPEAAPQAQTSMDLSGLDLSKLDLSQLKPYAGPRIKVTLPTRNPGDAETSVDLPAPGISEIYMSQDMQRGIKRDIRRRLLAESRSRTRQRGQSLADLTAVEEEEPDFSNN